MFGSLMTKYEPIPKAEVTEWAERLTGKSLDEVIATLGPPIRELGPSDWTGLSPGEPPRPIRNTRSLVFPIEGGTIRTIVAHVREAGHIGFTFQGKELVDS